MRPYRNHLACFEVWRKKKTLTQVYCVRGWGTTTKWRDYIEMDLEEWIKIFRWIKQKLVLLFSAGFLWFKELWQLHLMYIYFFIFFVNRRFSHLFWNSVSIFFFMYCAVWYVRTDGSAPWYKYVKKRKPTRAGGGNGGRGIRSQVFPYGDSNYYICKGRARARV